jgi:hypothetical protein
MTVFNADTINEFETAAFEKYGVGSLGKTDSATSYTYHFKDGKLTSVSYTFKATSDWAVFGGGKANKANKDAIEKCVRLSQEHEQKHKEGYERTFTQWKAQAEKDLKAGTYKDAKEAENAIEEKIHDLNNKLRDACLDLHSKEGLIVVTYKNGSPIDVSMTVAGKMGCDDS